MTKEEIKFEIEVLQRNKIIMACEAVAVNTAVMLGVYVVERFMEVGGVKDVVIWLGVGFGIGYALYASMGNLFKHMEIKRLHKELVG